MHTQKFQTDQPVRWIEGLLDTLYWLSYRKQDHVGKPLPLVEYLRNLLGKRVYAYWQLDDPIPCAARAVALVGNTLQVLRSRFRPRNRKAEIVI